MDANRRLPGAIDPARPGRGSNTLMQPFRMKPVPGGITPDGMPSEWVSDTTRPSASTHETCVVSFASPAGPCSRGTDTLSPRRMPAAQDSAYSSDSRRSSGGGTKRGSLMWASLSRVAIFIASATTRMYSGLLWPSATRSKRSRMRSISATMTPPPGGRLVANS